VYRPIGGPLNTPPERQARIRAQQWAALIPADTRQAHVRGDPRAAKVAADVRAARVPADDRTG
jgi:hypothetical protein